MTPKKTVFGIAENMFALAANLESRANRGEAFPKDEILALAPGFAQPSSFGVLPSSTSSSDNVRMSRYRKRWPCAAGVPLTPPDGASAEELALYRDFIGRIAGQLKAGVAEQAESALAAAIAARNRW